MPAMTLADLRNEFYARGFRHLKDGTGAGSDDRANRFINQGANDVYVADDWDWLRTSKTGTGTTVQITSVASGGTGRLRVVEQVVDLTTNTKLAPINRVDLGDLDPTLAQNGSPIYYYVERDFGSVDGSARIVPWPGNSAGHSIKVHYLVTPDAMDDDSDQHFVPPPYESAIIDYAVARAYIDSDNPQGAAMARSEAERTVAQMRLDLWDSLDYPPMMQQVVGGVDSYGRY